MSQLFGWDRVDISLTVDCRAILKIVKSMCNGIKKIKCTLMKCHTNVNSTPPTQLPHRCSYMVAIFMYSHLEFIKSAIYGSVTIVFMLVIML
jgi:hypothetical protein